MSEPARKVMSVDNISVVKRDGTKAQFNIDKIHRMVERACENLTGVSVSDVEMEAHLSFYDGITSIEIHRSLTKAAADLITENTPNYQYVAGRLLMYDIRKTAWGGMNPPSLYDHITQMVEERYYDPNLLEMYTKEDWDAMDAIIDHDKDLKMTHIAVKEYLTKYSVRDRSLDEVTPRETPQFTYILISALMRSDTRSLKDIKAYYADVSNGNITLPTPIMAGMRTRTKQFSSCVLIETDDTLNSLTDTSSAIQKYVAKKAGIGIGTSAVRPEGSPVGEDRSIKHTGVIPFYRQFQGSVKSCSQGGVRGGAATLHALAWHPEIDNILVLKNNKGTEFNRARQLDYSVIVNNTMYQRLIDDSKISLFSPKECPDLYEAYFRDADTFSELYEKYEDNGSRVWGEMPAEELFGKMMMERKDTGRIYIMNINNVNNHSSFLDPVRMSNLCQEITLITVPMSTVEEYEIYCEKDKLIETLNELGKSDVVKRFEITGGI
jgi:ribonucleoside-diphosphate reductase alpha chain